LDLSLALRKDLVQQVQLPSKRRRRLRVFIDIGWARLAAVKLIGNLDQARK
jgi:hypothetical protein